MSHRSKIFDSLLRWKALPVGILHKVSEIDNYHSCFVIMKRLEKKGYLKTLHLESSSRARAVYPTKKLLDLFKDENTIIIEERQLVHDTLVSSFCLGMLTKEKFREAKIEDRLIGHDLYSSFRHNYPDAILEGFSEKSKFEVPVELELTQKSTIRIIEKFKNYLTHDYYKNVIFVFDSKRIAKKYIEVWEEYILENHRDQALKRFIFTWGQRENLIRLNLDDFDVFTQNKSLKMVDLWKDTAVKKEFRRGLFGVKTS